LTAWSALAKTIDAMPRFQAIAAEVEWSSLHARFD
jgi:hypothetical protein